MAIHRASPDFWKDYHALPADIRARADKQFALLKDNPQHPSLQFKKIGDRNGQEIWSARVTLKYRALAVKLSGECVWFWGQRRVRYWVSFASSPDIGKALRSIAKRRRRSSTMFFRLAA